jgi:hypothetical protein
MNCNRKDDQLIDYLLNTLSDRKKTRLAKHLAKCSTCQQKLEDYKKTEKLLKQWKPFVSPTACSKITKQFISNIKAQRLIEKSSRKSLSTIMASEKEKFHSDTVDIRDFVVWRMITSRKVVATALAAVIIIGILLGINLFTRQSTESVAWENMIKKIEEIKFYKFQRTMSVIGTYEEVVTEKTEVYRSADYGILINRYFTGIPSVYTPPSEYSIREYGSLSDNTLITAYPGIKKYTTYHLPRKNVYRLHEFFDIVTYLKMISSFDYEKLDGKIIDGKEVVGFEIIDKKYGKELFETGVVRIWIDRDTNLPVLYEFLGTVLDKIRIGRIVLDKFEWYEKGDERIFEPDLSEYQLVAEVEVGPSDEETCILALQRFAEIADGRYPMNLSHPDALWELSKIYRKRTGGKHFYWEEEDFEWEDYAFLRAHLAATGMFYGELFIEYKDVAYHGKVISASDKDLPLLRWKISDEKYRVIFGDLRIEEVRTTELTGIEANLPKEDVFE